MYSKVAHKDIKTLIRPFLGLFQAFRVKLINMGTLQFVKTIQNCREVGCTYQKASVHIWNIENSQ